MLVTMSILCIQNVKKENPKGRKFLTIGVHLTFVYPKYY